MESVTPTTRLNQANRCGDRHHKQSLGRQRKTARPMQPHEHAEVVAKVCRKALADGLPLPDLDGYGLNEDVWIELCDLLTAEELEAVTAACGTEAEALLSPAGDDDEPIPYDITPEPQHMPSWRSREPKYVHSLKWRDAEGCEHLHVIRTDDMDELVREVTAIKALIATAKAKAEASAVSEPEASPVADEPRPGWCGRHHVYMKQRGDESRGYWYSHKDPDGSWCRGK
jgi:hypothetical protein